VSIFLCFCDDEVAFRRCLVGDHLVVIANHDISSTDIVVNNLFLKDVIVKSSLLVLLSSICGLDEESFRRGQDMYGFPRMVHQAERS